MAFQIIAQEKKKVEEIPQSLERLLALLEVLPEETTREYEETVVSYATKCPDDVLLAAEAEFWRMKDIAEGNSRKTQEEKIPLNEGVYFALYALLVNYTRRMKDDKNQKKLLDLYQSCYFSEEHVFYAHLRLLRMLGMVYNQSPSEQMEMLELAKQNKRDLVANGGAAHAFAEAVALVYELDDVADTPRFTDQRSEWLENALSAVENAINDRPEYAKYYCTRGRIRSLLGKYADALKDIDKAIDEEDTSRKDYPIRIGSYESRGQQIHAKMEQHGVQRHFEHYMATETQKYQDELVAREKETATKNMEFLGLFSGIVSFTIGSLTISGAIAEQSIAAAAGLIVVLMGALITAFAGFGIILHGTGGKKIKVQVKDKKTGEMVEKMKRDWRNVAVLVLGVMIVLGGLALCLCIPNPSASQEAATALTKTVLELV